MESCTVYIVMIFIHMHATICVACLVVICTAGNESRQFKGLI